MNEFLHCISVRLGNRSYRYLAREVGLSHSWIAGLFNGKNTLTFQTCKKLAQWAEIDSFEAFKLAGLLSDREAVK